MSTLNISELTSNVYYLSPHEGCEFSSLYKYNPITVAVLLCHIREIFRVLDLMKMDMANFKIDNLRPVLQRQSVEYERANFQSILEKTPSK